MGAAASLNGLANYILHQQQNHWTVIMAAPQQYSLRWNNYFRHLTYALDNHRVNDDFVDVSLLCDGRKIKAHKVVLSACSSYFKEIFTENPHPHPVIIFKFIKYEDLNSIIEFMYQVCGVIYAI